MKTDISLSKKVNYPQIGGVMTKQQFIERARAAGWTVESKELNGYQNGEYNRIRFNRLSGDEQTRYEEKMRKTKTVYSIYPPGVTHFYDISKTEYDYFKTLCQ